MNPQYYWNIKFSFINLTLEPWSSRHAHNYSQVIDDYKHHDSESNILFQIVIILSYKIETYEKQCSASRGKVC